MSLTALGVISRAMRLNGALAGADTPDPDDTANYLIALNAMKRAWFGTLIGPRLGSQSVSGTAGQAENGGEYAIPGGTAFTLNAPTHPKAGARFAVADAGLAFAATPCTINPNGRLIEGASGNLTLSANGDNRRWWYRADIGGWVREADYATPQAVIEFPDAIIAYMPYMLALAVAGEMASDLRPDIVAAHAEGRQVLARMYGRRGRGSLEGPIGLAAALSTPAAAAPQG